jgi:hypothetical protein
MVIVKVSEGCVNRNAHAVNGRLYHQEQATLRSDQFRNVSDFCPEMLCWTSKPFMHHLIPVVLSLTMSNLGALKKINFDWEKFASILSASWKRSVSFWIGFEQSSNEDGHQD